MRPTPLYSSTRRSLEPSRVEGGGAKGPGPSAAAGRSDDGGGWRAGLREKKGLITRIKGLPPRFLPVLATVVLILVALGLAASGAGRRQLGQKDIDAAVEYALQHRAPDPSPASVAYEAVRPSVVEVKQLPLAGQGEEELGVGTGVVITESGLILTNFHVIAGAPRLVVVFSDDSSSEVEVVSADPDRDLAVLQAKVLPDDLKPVTLRSIAGLKSGDEVFAVGYPFGIGPSLSAGVISGFDRSYLPPKHERPLTGLIQFDAAANPGNSGGPLVDREGQVVGLVTSILNPNEERVFIGIAFAVPIEAATSGFVQNPF
jgi:S1-C subfamily serine protease